MLDAAHGDFDHVVAMDSLIHYALADVAGVLEGIAARTRHSIVFTFAPSTPLLATLHAVGRAFPRADRAPAIEPVAERRLRDRLAADLPAWQWGGTERVKSGFYTSQAVRLEHSGQQGADA